MKIRNSTFKNNETQYEKCDFSSALLGKQLVSSCFHSDLEQTKLLVETKGADVNYRNVHGETPLYAAASAGWLVGVQYLVSRGAKLKESKNASDMDALHAACSKGAEELVLYLTGKGFSLHDYTFDGGCSLHIAVRTGQAHLIPWLVARKVSPNIEDRNGWSPLHRAAELSNRLVCIKLLVRCGARVNQLTGHGDSVLHIVAAKKTAEKATMQWLIEHGARLLCHPCEHGRYCHGVLEKTVTWVMQQEELVKTARKDELKAKLKKEEERQKEDEKKDWTVRKADIQRRMRAELDNEAAKRHAAISRKSTNPMAAASSSATAASTVASSSSSGTEGRS